MNDEEYITGIARTVHEANRAWNIALNDQAPDSPWDVLPVWHKRQIIRRVLTVKRWIENEELDDTSLAILIHGSWVDEMKGRGWALGDVKDPTATPPTHTCLKHWKECPLEQQVKDTMAIGIVRNLLRAR